MFHNGELFYLIGFCRQIFMLVYLNKRIIFLEIISLFDSHLNDVLFCVIFI